MAVGLVVALIVGVLVAGAPSPAGAAPACTHNWVGGTTGNWEVAGNWSPAEEPGATPPGSPVRPHFACVPAGITVTIGSGVGPMLLGVSVAGTIVVTGGGKLVVSGDPATHASTIKNLRLGSGYLGGTGRVTITGVLRWGSEATGASTMTTRELQLVPPVGGTTTKPTRFGETIVAAGASLVLHDDNATGCGPTFAGSGVNLRDGRRLINRGTFTIEPCAYVAADWGTAFTNQGRTVLLGSLGWFQGFLGSDLGWPTQRGTVTNASGASLRLQPTGGDKVFVVDARFVPGGSVAVANGATLSILDPSNRTARATVAPAAAVGLGGCVGGTECSTPSASQQDQEVWRFANAKRTGAPASTSSVTEAAGYVDTPFRPGRYEVGRRATFSATGAATAADPYVIDLTVDAFQVDGAPAGIAVGWIDNGTKKVVPACSGAAVDPCVKSKATLSGGFNQGDVRFVVHTARTSLVLVPEGPRRLR